MNPSFFLIKIFAIPTKYIGSCTYELIEIKMIRGLKIDKFYYCQITIVNQNI